MLQALGVLARAAHQQLHSHTGACCREVERQLERVALRLVRDAGCSAPMVAVKVRWLCSNNKPQTAPANQRRSTSPCTHTCRPAPCCLQYQVPLGGDLWLVDKLMWDLNQPRQAIELYVCSLCRDLKLGWMHFAVIQRALKAKIDACRQASRGVRRGAWQGVWWGRVCAQWAQPAMLLPAGCLLPTGVATSAAPSPAAPLRLRRSSRRGPAGCR